MKNSQLRFAARLGCCDGEKDKDNQFRRLIMPEPDITKRPKRKKSDVVRTLVKAGISAVPFYGSPANELLSLVMTSSIEKRHNKWLESIAEKLKVLEEHNADFKIENLCDNELFISTVMQASQVAMRNHQKEKLEALQNAVLNAALPNAPEEDLQLMFLNFVDSLTLAHLRMLKYLNDFEAKRPSNRSKGVRIEFIAKSKEKTSITAQQVWPDLGNRKNFYNQVLKDLQIRGLLKVSMSDTADFLDKIVSAQPTNLGKQLLAFVKLPFARHNNADSSDKTKAKQ